MKRSTRFRALTAGAALAIAGIGLVPAAAHAAGEVAEIGGTQYLSLADAFAAAVSSADANVTISLLANAPVSSLIEVSSGKSITLQLNGHEVAVTGANTNRISVRRGALAVQGSGTMTGSYIPLAVYGNADVALTNTLSISGATIVGGAAGAAVFVGHNAAGNNGVVLNVTNSTIRADSHGSGVDVNGSITAANASVRPLITISNSLVEGTGSGSFGAYLAGTADTTFSNSQVSGNSVGIEIRAGKLTLNNTNVTGGTGTPASSSNSSGSTASNVGLSVAQHTTGQPIDLSVHGTGIITGGASLQVANPETGNPTMTGVAVEVAGGQFVGPVVSQNQQTPAAPVQGFISGGSFDEALDQDLVASSAAMLVGSGGDSASVMSPQDAAAQAGASAVINGQVVYFEDVADALDAAANPADVELLAPPAATPGASLALSASGSTLAPGQELVLTASGFKPGSTVEALLFSTPVSLGTAVANSSGVATISVTIPANTAKGPHTLVVRGVDAADAFASAQFSIEVKSLLADTGASAAPMLGMGGAALLLAGAVLLLTRRVRAGSEN